MLFGLGEEGGKVIAIYFGDHCGDGPFERKDSLNGILEILPCEIKVFKDREAELRVFYEDQPLADAEVKAVSDIEGKQMSLIMFLREGRRREDHSC